MTRDEATDLATRICQTWPRAIPAHVWEEELLELDAGRAGTALAKLRRTEKHAPSIAEFFDMYRSLNTDDRSTRPPDCSRCDNQGTVSTLADNGDGVLVWQPVTPCSCGWGAEKAKALASAAAANERELHRLFPSRDQIATRQPTPPAVAAAPLF